MTHMITCQGRDHFVNVQYGRQILVIVNVHFEPELILRQLRERLRLINPHWPSYPNAVGIILGDVNICEPEEGRFNVWNQTFTDGDRGKAALFHSLFPHVLEIAQLGYTRRDSAALGVMRALSWIDRIFMGPVPRAIGGCMHLMVYQWRPRQMAEVRSLQSQLHSVSRRSASGDRIILPLSSMSEVFGIKTVLLSSKCSGTVPPSNSYS